LNAPPIPPRLLWSGERRDLRIQEADSAGSKQTEIIADFDNPLVKFVNPSENVRLMNENEELKKANNVLVVQISLLEQKSSMIADINEKINIRRDLLEDIALKEKENNALIAGNCFHTCFIYHNQTHTPPPPSPPQLRNRTLILHIRFQSCY
jgi:hypothetical protein